MINKNKRIAIIGAGPGGLTLARILQQAGFNPVVFEGETSATQREQGGTLDLTEDMGQKALRAAGLFDQFKAICRYEGEALKVMNKSADVLYEDCSNENAEQTTSRPEIDRKVLRQMLLDSVNQEAIKWGHKLLYATPLENGQHKLHFENGATETVDLVVGADGAFSKLRPLVSKETAEYSGVSMVEINILDAKNQFPDIVEMNGLGSVFALDDYKGMLAQMNGDGKIRVYLSFKAPKEWLHNNGINYENLKEAKQELLKLFEDWSPELKKYIHYANGAIFPRRIYMLPVGHKWTHKKGVTLLGDAAHLMSPFAGAGANLAMLDASELALSITTHDNIDEAVYNYELKMFEYAAEIASETKRNMDLFFEINAAEKLTELMKTHYVE
ncbi:FAD-dependent monooxygenase [Bacillus inaquosorum]|uniref:FAD-dependent oxidoreductase n=2 Tax=Bacillus inaquosorum TaxID=483913 RepID=UPI00227F681C|nr:NAD(P)/FAD-dependent oxidoreductase [Bacillus inaquosorum]MCY8421763.1 FAD-dependent monooxygenase [Bacillus inaquosorum]MEC0980035.1 NAD(P)/FAD-dependent oxidoreductase [Bacillus inaquosorum]